MIKKSDLSESSISSINLAIEEPNSWLLSEDDKTRLYALNIGLNVMSTIRVLEDAVVKGEIKSIDEMVELLREMISKNAFHITEDMLSDIVRIVENRIKERDENLRNEKEFDFSQNFLKAIKKIEESNTPKDPFTLFGIDHYYGWYGLTLPIIEEVRLYNIKHPDDQIQIQQIKEKFGGLRIYLSKEPEYLHKMILKAEHESEHICEICGARGSNVKIDGWVWTLCEEHRKAKTESNHDQELEDHLYKKMLNIENYGWKTSNLSKEKQVEIKEGE